MTCSAMFLKTEKTWNNLTDFIAVFRVVKICHKMSLCPITPAFITTKSEIKISVCQDSPDLKGS